ncbi:MAG: hypothetical protein ACFE8A_07880 [Candidatus Hodarchaeota archaeon]
MNAKQIFSLLSGIVTLVATFFFTLFKFELAENTYYVSGMYGIIRIFQMFLDPISMFYIMAVVILIIFMSSGVLQIIGVKARLLTIVGSILPLFFGIIILLDPFNLLNKSFIGILFMLGGKESIIPDILPFVIPFDFVIFERPESIGTYFLILGGMIGLISGLFERGEV